MKKTAFFAAVGLFCLTAAQMFGAPVAYGINDSGIYSINLSNGAVTALGGASVTPGADGLALNRPANTLYWRQGPVGPIGGAVGDFSSYNLGSAAQVNVTPEAINPVTNGTANGGNYYFIAQSTDDAFLVTYNAAGTATGGFAIGDITGNTVSFRFGDIAYNEQNGLIYGYSEQGFFSVQTNGTGYTPIAPALAGYPFMELGYDDLTQIMYTHNFATGEWFTIDIATGTLAAVLDGTGNALVTAGFQDIALRGSAVPEPSTYALIGAGLAAVAVRARRNRK